MKLLLDLYHDQNGAYPTDVVQRVWNGLELDSLKERDLFNTCVSLGLISIDNIKRMPPKNHAIVSVGNEVEEGDKVFLLIKGLAAGVFQFCPSLLCHSVQDLEIISNVIFIDGRELNEEESDQFAFREGYDTANDLLLATSGDYVGKIIHWTNFNY